MMIEATATPTAAMPTAQRVHVSIFSRKKIAPRATDTRGLM